MPIEEKAGWLGGGVAGRRAVAALVRFIQTPTEKLSVYVI